MAAQTKPEDGLTLTDWGFTLATTALGYRSRLSDSKGRPRGRWIGFRKIMKQTFHAECRVPSIPPCAPGNVPRIF